MTRAATHINLTYDINHLISKTQYISKQTININERGIEEGPIGKYIALPCSCSNAPTNAWALTRTSIPAGEARPMGSVGPGQICFLVCAMVMSLPRPIIWTSPQQEKPKKLTGV